MYQRKFGETLVFVLRSTLTTSLSLSLSGDGFTKNGNLSIFRPSFRRNEVTPIIHFLVITIGFDNV